MDPRTAAIDARPTAADPRATGAPPRDRTVAARPTDSRDLASPGPGPDDADPPRTRPATPPGNRAWSRPVIERIPPGDRGRPTPSGTGYPTADPTVTGARVPGAPVPTAATSPGTASPGTTSPRTSSHSPTSTEPTGNDRGPVRGAPAPGDRASVPETEDPGAPRSTREPRVPVISRSPGAVPRPEPVPAARHATGPPDRRGDAGPAPAVGSWTGGSQGLHAPVTGPPAVAGTPAVAGPAPAPPPEGESGSTSEAGPAPSPVLGPPPPPSVIRRRPAERSADRDAGRSRGLDELVTEFGGTLPKAPLDPPRRRDADQGLFSRVVGKRGRRAVGHGWAPVPAPLVTYRASTAQIGGVFPLLSANGLPPTGALVGYDVLSAGAFYFDPVGWVLAQPAIVTNPNIITFGKPGTGKSATVKVCLLRLMRFGVRTVVAGDVKGEYEDVCRAVGVEPIALGPGLAARINALDLGPLGQGWAELSRDEVQRRSTMILSRWLVLLRALIGVRGVGLSPSGEEALGAVLRELTGWSSGGTRLRPVTIPQVWQALRDPTATMAAECRYNGPEEMRRECRLIADALGVMVRGSLSGLFDEETNVDLDWTAPIQSLSLQRLRALGDEATGVALACVNSWCSAMLDLRRPGDVTLTLRDEVWRQMRLGLGAVQSLDADLRLSRSDGAIQWIIAHKPSDLLSVGDLGSQAVTIAKDMLNLCDTKVLMGQDTAIADELDTLLGLGTMQRDWVTGWARQRLGRGLWLVGERAFKVQTVLTRAEEQLVDTNRALDAG